MHLKKIAKAQKDPANIKKHAPWIRSDL
jgi:hypothetical protein